MLLILKLLSLIAFVGGPLVLSDVLRAAIAEPWNFVAAFTPVGLVLFGSMALGDADDAGRTWSVRAGNLGAALLLVQNAWAVYWLCTQPAHEDGTRTLHGVGIAIGTLCALLYLALALGALRMHELAFERWFAQHRAIARDWLLLTISAGFVGAGLVLWRHAPQSAIVTIVLFGACGIVPVLSMRRRLRERREPLEPGGPLVLPADRTLRPKRMTAVLLFGGLMLGGGLVFALSAAYPTLFRVLTAGVAAIGGAGLLAVAAGWAPVGFVRFDPSCLSVGHRRYELHVPWTDLAAAEAGEYMDNPAVFLALQADAAWTTTPPEQRAKAEAYLARTERWCGAPIVIMTTHYGISASALAHALQAELDRARR